MAPTNHSNQNKPRTQQEVNNFMAKFEQAGRRKGPLTADDIGTYPAAPRFGDADVKAAVALKDINAQERAAKALLELNRNTPKKSS
jgi:hypothetical protein